MENEEIAGSCASPDYVFGLTRSPYLNDLVRIAEAFYYEEQCPEAHLESLGENLRLMKQVATALWDAFNNVKKIQEDSPVAHEQNVIIEENLTLLNDALSKLEEVVATNNKQILVESVWNSKIATERLFAAFDALRAEEEKMERDSLSPYFNELIRIARGVARGAFPPEVLKDMLDVMIAYWDKTYKDFNIYSTQAIDSGQIKEKIPALKKAYEDCGAGLFEMVSFFQDNETRHLEEGATMVRSASNSMVEVYEAIHKAISSESIKACLRCGKDNPVNVKSCIHCQAQFPSYAREDVSPEIDLKVGEGITPLSQRMVTAHIQKLIDVVNSFERGEGNLEDLTITLGWLWEKIQEGKNRLIALKVPEGMGDEEDKSLLNHSHDLLERGIAELESAIIEMNLYPQDGDILHLRGGLQAAINANDKVWEVQQISQKLWEKYSRPNE